MEQAGGVGSNPAEVATVDNTTAQAGAGAGNDAASGGVDGAAEPSTTALSVGSDNGPDVVRYVKPMKHSLTLEGKFETAQELKAQATEYVNAGKLKAAARTYKKALLYTTGIPGLSGGLDEYAVMLGSKVPTREPREALLEQPIKDFNVIVWTNLTIVYLKLEKYDRCMNYITKALEAAPNHPKAGLFHGRVLQAQGKLTEAQTAYTDLLQRLKDSDDDQAAAASKTATKHLKKVRKQLAKQERLHNKRMARAMARSLGNP